MTRILLLLIMLSTGCTIRQVVPRPTSRGEVQHNFEQVFNAVAALVQDDSVYCSGVFHREYIITAKHCVTHATVLNVATYGHFDQLSNTWARYYQYTLVYSAPGNVDLAILSPISPGDGEHVSLTVAEKPHLGETVFAFGHPLGFPYHFTEGRITAERREFNGEYLTFSNVSAQPGNSGGPLLNDDGEIVGIVVVSLLSNSGETTSVIGSVHVDEILTALEAADID